MLACGLQEWSTSGVSLATGLTGCIVLIIRTLRARVVDEEPRNGRLMGASTTDPPAT